LSERFAAFFFIPHAVKGAKAIYGRVSSSFRRSRRQKPLSETKLSVNSAKLPGKAQLMKRNVLSNTPSQDTFLSPTLLSNN